MTSPRQKSRLEVLYAPARGRRQSVDLLLVHGIFVGAWVWEEHMMSYLADAGYDVHAVSLTGHGKSAGRERLGSLTLSNYSDDVAEMAATLERPAVVVGHSMGGAAVQDAIRKGLHCAGAVLMASVPPSGLMAANLAMMWQRPQLWRALSLMFSAGFHSVDTEAIRSGLFSDRIDRETFARFLARGGQESALVGFELQGMRPFAPLPWAAPPTLVIGGGEDRLLRRDDVWATANWYGTEARILPGVSHSVMLDPDWRLAADAMLRWLEKLQAAPAELASAE